MRWTRIPWTILVATISSAQMQPDPTTGTGRPAPGPSRPDTVSVDSTDASAARGATTNRAATASATIVTLRASDGVALAADRATVRDRLGAGPFASRGADESEASTFELERMDGLWRVRAWHEAVSGEPDATASVRADARLRRRDAPDPTGTPDAAAASPSRLAIRARADRPHGTLAFEVALPEAGGTLELFDVAGRRVTQRDLGGLAPGVRRVAVEARGLGAGVYFARVRQRGATATAHVRLYR